MLYLQFCACVCCLCPIMRVLKITYWAVPETKGAVHNRSMLAGGLGDVLLLTTGSSPCTF